IATGTLFNYFPTKEALALAIVGKCLEGARDEFRGRLRGDEALDERLFAYVATSLRHLRPHREYVAGLLEGSLSPLGDSAADVQGADSVRRRHLDTVGEQLASNGAAGEDGVSPLSLHLYWTLFLGVVSYWAADPSPQQEDTLVLLDQSMALFVASISTNATPNPEVNDGTQTD
ncbi:MAG: TetR/AcrR family transcriptional regulator, partial [bacterium]|nr:TetR/AcrR family transcriptional regulator [bacterium]